MTQLENVYIPTKIFAFSIERDQKTELFQQLRKKVILTTNMKLGYTFFCSTSRAI